MNMYSKSGEFSYSLEDGCATITGYENISDTFIEIPAEINGHSVRVIGEDAFFHCSVKQIVIPEGVEKICRSAFAECSYLKKVILPSTLKKICEFAFYECDSLEVLRVPVNCEIERSAVVGYSFRNYVYIGEGSRHYEIDGVVFDKETDYLVLYPSEKLDSEYVIPEFVKGITAKAFRNVKALKKITIPETMTEISFGAFQDLKSLESVVLHDKVTWIYNDAFKGCSSLRHIELPDSIEGISRYAFAYSGLEEFVVPKKERSIASGVFAGCSNLRKIENTEQLLSIGRYAFQYCSSLEEFSFGSGIVTIEHEAFGYCTALKKVNLPEFSKKPPFDQAGVSENTYNVILPDSLITIQSECFIGCESLESVSVPRNTNFYNADIVDRCKSIRKLFLPLSIERISGDNMGHPTYITDIYYEGNENDWEKISKSDRLKENLKKITVHFNCSEIE